VVLKELMAYWPVLKCFESDLERRLHRSNPHFLPPSKTTVQQLLQSPRPLIVDERYPPTLAAFINASKSIPAESDASFIHRQYGNPNAFRYSEKEREESCTDEENTEDTLIEELMTREGRSDAIRHNDAHHADPDKTFPSTEESSRSEDPSPQEEGDTTFTNTLSPLMNTISNTTATELLGGNFMDLEAPSENLWGFGDFFSDNWGELLPGPSSNDFD